jgi:DNA-binding GntR family transcriptional regulator
MKDTGSAARRSVLPRYYQLKELIRDKIRQQEWQPGTAIPSERELVGRYGMSRMTVRQALTELANEGVLHREQGKGTFVSQDLHPQSLMRLSGFTELIEAQGQQPTTQVLSAQMWPADKRVAQALCLRPGLPVFRLHRLRFATGKPLANPWRSNWRISALSAVNNSWRMTWRSTRFIVSLRQNTACHSSRPSKKSWSVCLETKRATT